MSKSKAEHDPGEILRLANLVLVMRSAQNAHLQDPNSKQKRRLARELEQKVDTAVRWVTENRQPRLFSDPPAAPCQGPYGGGS